MPSRKQRRRREKLKRHEYEYVVETEDGEEVRVERFRDADPGRAGRGAGKQAGPRKGEVLVDRRGRPIQRPSLGRVLRRAAIFAPVLFVFVYLTAPDDLAVAGMIFNTLVLVAFFIPFSYLVDTMVYRMMIRRYERDKADKRGG